MALLYFYFDPKGFLLVLSGSLQEEKIKGEKILYTCYRPSKTPRRKTHSMDISSESEQSSQRSNRKYFPLQSCGRGGSSALYIGARKKLKITTQELHGLDRRAISRRIQT